jgi:hypothetical protein
MATCAYCKNTILFGGKRSGNLRFCSEKCMKKGTEAIAVDQLVQQIPEELVQKQILAVHQGDCPKCGRPGPVDVHTSHRAWSLIHVTVVKSRPHVSCRACATRAQLGDTIFSALLGFWGVPFGIVLTPVQIVRNIFGIFFGPDPSKPSPKLEEHVRLDLAHRVAAIHSSIQAEKAESSIEQPDAVSQSFDEPAQTQPQNGMFK